MVLLLLLRSIVKFQQVENSWGLIYKTSYDNRKIVVKPSQLCHIFVINQQVMMS